jgi:hypothetical protein
MQSRNTRKIKPSQIALSTAQRDWLSASHGERTREPIGARYTQDCHPL